MKAGALLTELEPDPTGEKSALGWTAMRILGLGYWPRVEDSVMKMLFCW